MTFDSAEQLYLIRAVADGYDKTLSEQIMNLQISKAIYKATGYKGVKVHKGGGVCKFFFEEGCDNQGLDLHEAEAVYVCALSHLTVEDWVLEFKDKVSAVQA